MNEYTIETLIEHNPRYHSEHRVTQSDVDKANHIKRVIESTRNDATPQVGDIVQYTDKYGNYHPKSHIENVEDGKLYICENPYVPFVDVRSGRVSTSTSGGAWGSIPANLVLVGKAPKAFCDWGHCGPCGNGAIDVVAEVNVWRYVDGNPEFTTENYDKFYVTFHDRPVGVGYLITVMDKNCTNHTAFRNHAEYRNWLDTFHGVERDNNWSNGKIVWTYKQKVVYHVPIEVFAIIDGVEDETLSNGSMRKCKRVYDGTTVTTYVLVY